MNQTAINAKIAATLGLPPVGFGSRMGVLKYAGKVASAPNPYDYKQSKFSAPVEVVGRATVNPSAEVISRYGGTEKKYDIMFVWAVVELRQKFPAAQNLAWVSTDDQVVFEGNTYLLNHVKPSGHTYDDYTVVVAFGTTAKGVPLKGP